MEEAGFKGLDLLFRFFVFFFFFFLILIFILFFQDVSCVGVCFGFGLQITRVEIRTGSAGPAGLMGLG